LLLGKGLGMEIIDAVDGSDNKWHIYARIVPTSSTAG